MANLRLPLMIKMCIYYRNDLSQSYIGAPIIRQDTQEMLCPQSNQGWHVGDNFYAINPMITPIPSYFRLICAKRSVTADKGYNTVSVVTNYDPFNLDNNCTYFMTWTQPTPYTTPLYIYKNGGGVLVSFEKKNMTQAFLSPLYVLTDKPREGTIFTGERKWFEIKNNVPIFLFRNDNGRCIPEPGGVTLEQCALTNNLEMNRPLSLLDVLREETENKRKNTIINKVPKVVQRINIFLIVIFLIIFLVSLGIVLYVGGTLE